MTMREVYLNGIILAKEWVEDAQRSKDKRGEESAQRILDKAIAQLREIEKSGRFAEEYLMKPKKTIQEYLPVQAKVNLVQARVSADIIDKMKNIMARENLGWNEVITACLLNLIDSYVEKPKGSMKKEKSK